MTLNHIIFMGGYGVFVWSAYFLTLVVFCLNVFFTFKEKKYIKKYIKRYLVESV